MMKRVRLVISGKVQGVCFRTYACEEARAGGIRGWVRNRSNGSVELLAEGEETALADLAAWCRRGPPHADVRGVTASSGEATGEFGSFEIRF